ncbi:hypothetical protein HG535_0A08190 [Zygotorulaspora mrakii]|uniref:Probable metalloreductase AIM14 n=1 Tax=Zygotorulaspora mrakii TaxID=42260 RepID=A0A7H9AXP7_ZYGMR|nr:uncharacterized protein HG535_0A08190 [Zygotorulaspora mrakii]QLG70874.1 hypothetical protein HG535_0A08190 [Zygotorulaspora mrakii]
MESYELIKRHGETHFANIKYGYYTLAISIIYLAFLVALRSVVNGKPTNSSSSKWKRFLYQLYSINPGVHLAIIWIPLLVPFYHHYSIVQHTTVYLKRLGRLSYVLLSLNMVLNVRPNWLFRKYYTYTDLIPLHKWLSRVIVMVGMIHGVLFLVYWALDDTRSTVTQILKYKNFIGLVLMFLVLLLVIFSSGPLRRINYNLFYVTHNIVLLSLVLLTGLHARPGVTFPYLLVNVALLCYQAFTKVLSRRAAILDKITDYKDSNLINVHLPRSALPADFEPGSHIRISAYRRLNPLYWLLPSHPYTIASLPSDSEIDLIILENKHPRSFKIERGVEYTVSQPYAPAIPRSCLENAKRVCIVCGGSGISFGLPLYKYYKEKLAVEFLQMVWIVRNKYQLRVLEGLATTISLNSYSEFHIFVTNSDSGRLSEEPQEDADLEFELESMSNEQLDENGALVDNDAAVLVSKYKPTSINFGRRMQWATDLAHFVEHSQLDDTWLLACGPQSLIESGKEYAADNEINFASEIYAL